MRFRGFALVWRFYITAVCGWTTGSSAVRAVVPAHHDPAPAVHTWFAAQRATRVRVPFLVERRFLPPPADRPTIRLLRCAIQLGHWFFVGSRGCLLPLLLSAHCRLRMPYRLYHLVCCAAHRGFTADTGLATIRLAVLAVNDSPARLRFASDTCSSAAMRHSFPAPLPSPVRSLSITAPFTFISLRWTVHA